jgi:sugar lactone lactonase YvrE
VDVRGRVEVIAAFDDSPSGLGFLPDGDLLIVLMHAGKIVRMCGGRISDYADLSRYAVVPNDMLVDKEGRAYVGQLGFDYRREARRSADLLAIESGGKVSVVASDLWGPNGIALTSDAGTLIVAESEGDRLIAWDRIADGRLANRRTFAQLPASHRPDGICLDADGGVWTALPFAMGMDAAPKHFGPGIVRVGVDGKISHLIHAPAGRRFVACVFGGEDRRELYICSIHTASPTKGRSELGARIERVRLAFTGAGLP